MALADVTLAQLQAAYRSTYNLQRAINEYNEGNPAPAVSQNRTTEEELVALTTAAKTAVDALDAALGG